ncbi:MAG: FKBP-type peptidyl-prolyl cis-trans isomerase [Acidobacteriota bacterium]
MSDSTPIPPSRRLAAHTAAWALTSTLACAAFAAEDVTTPPADAERLPSGVVMQVLEKGTGTVKPDSNDHVAVRFTGYNPRGHAVRKTPEDGQPVAFPMDKAFPGWREGLMHMVKGEKRRLWLPEALAPPKGQDGILVNIFDFELVGIRQLPNPPENLAKPEPGAERTYSGAFSKRIAEGQGDEKPHPEGRVVMHYVLWNEDGQALDSTYERARPTAFMLDKVMAPFSEAVQEMVVGEKRRIWIPAALNDGLWPKAPKKGPLIFEVEMLRILPDNALQPQGEGDAAPQGT